VVLLVAVVFAFLAPTLVAIGSRIAFGYDEAVYAQLTRHWLTGAPASGWDLHRPPGLSVLGILPQVFAPGTEWAQRVIGAAAGAGLVVAGWWAARMVGGRQAGIIAAVSLAAAAPLQVESASFLTDVPSTLVLVVIAGLGWRQLLGPGPIRRSFAWLGVLAVLAFYLRYGAVVELAGLAAASMVVAPRKLVAGWRPVATALIAFVAALVPHAVIAIAETGMPWGILASAGRAAGGGDGLPLLSYAAWFPWRLIGPLGAAVAAIGIVAIIRHAGSQAFARFIGVAAVVPIAVLGTLVHAEPRYLLVPMTLLVVAGSVELSALLSRRTPGRALNAALIGVAVAGLVLGAAVTAVEHRSRAEAFDWKREVGLDIGALAGGTDCSILTADVPIMSWYSGCPAVAFLGGRETDRIGLLTGSRRFVVVRADGHLQPPDPEVDRLLAGAEVWATYTDGRGRPAAVVYLLPEPSSVVPAGQLVEGVAQDL